MSDWFTKRRRCCSQLIGMQLVMVAGEQSEVSYIVARDLTSGTHPPVAGL
jgi:hypothetical protein